MIYDWLICFEQNDTWYCVTMSASNSFWFWLYFPNKSCVKSYQIDVIIASTVPVRLFVCHIWWFYCCDTSLLTPSLLTSSLPVPLIYCKQIKSGASLKSLWSLVLFCAALVFDTDKMDEPQTLSTSTPVPVLCNPHNNWVWSLG